MADSGELYTGMEVDDDLSSAMGTETLADRDLIPPGFDNAPRARTEGLPIEIFDNRRYLKVERSATLRKGAKLSKIWNYGTESTRLKALFNSRTSSTERCRGLQQPCGSENVSIPPDLLLPADRMLIS